MANFNISQAFLRDNAAKHFVCLSYRKRFPATWPEQTKSGHASCFVIETEGAWLLITAGHILKKMKAAIAAGGDFHDFVIHDKLAGNAFPYGVPFPFDVEQWVVIEGDPDGTDYAAALIPDLVVSGLRAGGVQPIGESAWGNEPLDQYSKWLLVGIPSESYSAVNNQHKLSLTLIPIEPTTSPAAATPSADRMFAKIVTQPLVDGTVVNDVDGMSGGPVFGVKEVGGNIRYWVIGIQSSWFKTPRIVCFAPVRHFFESIKRAIQIARQGGVG